MNTFTFLFLLYKIVLTLYYGAKYTCVDREKIVTYLDNFSELFVSNLLVTWVFTKTWNATLTISFCSFPDSSPSSYMYTVPLSHPKNFNIGIPNPKSELFVNNRKITECSIPDFSNRHYLYILHSKLGTQNCSAETQNYTVWTQNYTVWTQKLHIHTAYTNWYRNTKQSINEYIYLYECDKIQYKKGVKKNRQKFLRIIQPYGCHR